MALTNPFDTDTPGGSADPTQGDDRIRELKSAIVERETQDHYWPASGTTYNDDDCGFHKKSTLLVQTSITQKANAGILYTKDVSAKAELHFKDEYGNELQISNAGNLNGVPFITGDLLFSSVDTAHSGWTNVTATYAARYIRVGDTVLGTGGSATHTHTAGSFAVSGTTAASTADNPRTATSDLFSTAAHAHTHTFSASVTGTSAAGNNLPLYVDVRVFKKD